MASMYHDKKTRRWRVAWRCTQGADNMDDYLPTPAIGQVQGNRI
ncbi:MAG: hypothetical protein ACYSOV_08645 [Planctomycetota bacterium]